MAWKVLTSSSWFLSSASWRNWKVLIVKRRMWPWGDGGRGSNSTDCCRPWSKGLGHLGRNIKITQPGGKKAGLENPKKPQKLFPYLQSFEEHYTHCKEEPIQHFQTSGSPHNSAPGAPMWDPSCWAAVPPCRGVSPAISAGACDTEGNSCYTVHLRRAVMNTCVQ